MRYAAGSTVALSLQMLVDCHLFRHSELHLFIVLSGESDNDYYCPTVEMHGYHQIPDN